MNDFNLRRGFLGGLTKLGIGLGVVSAGFGLTSTSAKADGGGCGNCRLEDDCYGQGRCTDGKARVCDYFICRNDQGIVCNTFTRNCRCVTFC
jgi:hypothetical protein